jgi:hypothetical protein
VLEDTAKKGKESTTCAPPVAEKGVKMTVSSKIITPQVREEERKIEI